MSNTQRHRWGGPPLAQAASVAGHGVVLVVCLWLLGGWAVRAALHLGRWVFQPPVPAFGAVEVVAFYEPNCPACRRTRPLLDRLERRYPGYRWARVDLSYPRGRKLAQEYYLHYDVPARRRGTIPMVFAGTRIFTGFAAIRDELPAYLDQGTIARPLGHSASPARPSTGANR